MLWGEWLLRSAREGSIFYGGFFGDIKDIIGITCVL